MSQARRAWTGDTRTFFYFQLSLSQAATGVVAHYSFLDAPLASSNKPARKRLAENHRGEREGNAPKKKKAKKNFFSWRAKGDPGITALLWPNGVHSPPLDSPSHRREASCVKERSVDESIF
jgi:hypothetical protein